MPSRPSAFRPRTALLALATSCASLSVQSAPALAASLEWREITAPTAKYQAALLFDTDRQRLLSFAGWREYGLGPLRELWSFEEGVGWKRLPGAAPLPVVGANLVVDTRRQRLVTFGHLGDTWLPAGSYLATRPLDGSGDWVTDAYNYYTDFSGAFAVYDSTRDRIVAWRNINQLSDHDAVTREFPSGTAWRGAATTGTKPGFFGPGSSHLDRANERMIVVDHANGTTWCLSLSTMAWSSPDSLGGGPPLSLLATGFDQASQRIHALDANGGIHERPLEPGGPWRYVTTPVGMPPYLQVRSQAWDGSNQRILFHGWVPNEVWALVLGPAPRWERLAPALPNCPMSVANSLALDTRRNRVLLQPGYYTYWRSSCIGSGNFAIEPGLVRQTFGLELDLPLPGWQPLAIPSSGGFREAPNSSIVYDPVRDRALYFGGQYRALRECIHDGELYTNHTYKSGFAVGMDPAHVVTPFDTSVSPPPAARGHHGAVWDARRDRMLVVGGLPEEGPGFSEVWQLDGATLRWSKLSTTGTAPAGAVTVLLDQLRDRVIAIPRADRYLYRLDLQTLQWSRIEPTGQPFEPEAVFALDPVRDRLLVFGGSPSGTGTHVLWQIGLGDPPSVAPLAYPGTPEFAPRFTAVFDPVGDRLVLHGGYPSYHIYDYGLAGMEQKSTWVLAFGQPTATNVEIASVEAMRDRVRITIHAQRNGASFEVERQAEEAVWATRATISTDGTGLATWDDVDVSAGRVYRYRLAWWEGLARRTTEEREVRVPDVDAAFALERLHPNPAQGAISFSLSVPQPGLVDIVVQDILGRTVLRETMTFAEPGPQQRQLNLDENFPPGLYLLLARNAGQMQTRRFIVVR